MGYYLWGVDCEAVSGQYLGAAGTLQGTTCSGQALSRVRKLNDVFDHLISLERLSLVAWTCPCMMSPQKEFKGSRWCAPSAPQIISRLMNTSIVLKTIPTIRT